VTVKICWGDVCLHISVVALLGLPRVPAALPRFSARAGRLRVCAQRQTVDSRMASPCGMRAHALRSYWSSVDAPASLPQSRERWTAVVKHQHRAAGGTGPRRIHPAIGQDKKMPPKRQAAEVQRMKRLVAASFIYSALVFLPDRDKGHRKLAPWVVYGDGPLGEAAGEQPGLVRTRAGLVEEAGP
jgi:hypothetical protein